MRLKRNYYEVMGVSPDATPQEIKLKYHELARQFHPDRAKDKELAQRLFSQINMAYKTLAREADRARYDEVLEAESRPVSRMFQGARMSPVEPSPAPQASRPAATSPAPPPPAPAPRQASAKPSSPKPAARPSGDSQRARTAPRVPPKAPRTPLEHAMDQAQEAFMRGDMNLALKICDQVLVAYPRNFDALKLIGDTHAASFHNAEALDAYQAALKVQPGNFTVQDKVRRLQGISADVALNAREYASTSDAGSESPSSSGAKPQKKANIFRRMMGGSK